MNMTPNPVSIRKTVVAAVTVIAALSMLVVSASDARAHGPVDVSYNGTLNAVFAFGPLFGILGQEFIPSLPTLTGIDVTLFSAGFPDVDKDVTVTIHKGTITDAVLATSNTINITASSPPEGLVYHFDLTSPLTVVPDDVYVFQVEATGDGFVALMGSWDGSEEGTAAYLDGRGIVAGTPDWDGLAVDFFFNTWGLDTKAGILKGSGVPGKGIDKAPGLDKPFNEKGKGKDNAGKKK